MLVRAYPSPTSKFIDDFVKLLNTDDVVSDDKIITDEDYSVILMIPRVVACFYKDHISLRPTPLTDVKQVIYVMSGSVNTAKLQLTTTVQVGDYYFLTGDLLPLFKLLHKHRCIYFDFYLVKWIDGESTYLGIGSRGGFILVHGLDTPIGNHVPLYMILSKKYFITKRYQEKKNVPNEIDIQVPDHIIEKWIRELGLNL